MAERGGGRSVWISQPVWLRTGEIRVVELDSGRGDGPPVPGTLMLSLASSGEATGMVAKEEPKTSRPKVVDPNGARKGSSTRGEGRNNVGSVSLQSVRSVGFYSPQRRREDPNRRKTGETLSSPTGRFRGGGEDARGIWSDEAYVVGSGGMKRVLEPPQRSCA